jgi:UDP-glucose 4-epimerase
MKAGASRLAEFYNGKEVLILGGMGFMGSNTAHWLVKAGSRVTIFDAMFPQYGANPANLKGIESKVNVVKGDIRDFDELKKQVQGKDVILNYAAQVSHIDSMSDPLFDIDINCRGNINVLEAVRQRNDRARLVLASTRSQFGKLMYDPVDEKHPEFPTDIYSANKSAAEKYYLIYHLTHGIFASSLRITNVYGPRAQVKSATYGVVNYFIRLAIEGKTITVYEPGTQKRDCLFVDDAVSAMLLAGADERANGEVFNVASGATYPLLDIVKKIISIAGSGNFVLAPWPEDRKKIEVGDVSMSNAKIRGLLGWTPTVGLEDGIARTVEYFRPVISAYV